MSSSNLFIENQLIENRYVRHTDNILPQVSRTTILDLFKDRITLPNSVNHQLLHELPTNHFLYGAWGAGVESVPNITPQINRRLILSSPSSTPTPYRNNSNSSTWGLWRSNNTASQTIFIRHHDGNVEISSNVNFTAAGRLHNIADRRAIVLDICGGGGSGSEGSTGAFIAVGFGGSGGGGGGFLSLFIDLILSGPIEVRIGGGAQDSLVIPLSNPTRYFIAGRGGNGINRGSGGLLENPSLGNRPISNGTADRILGGRCGGAWIPNILPSGIRLGQAIGGALGHSGATASIIWTFNQEVNVIPRVRIAQLHPAGQPALSNEHNATQFTLAPGVLNTEIMGHTLRGGASVQTDIEFILNTDRNRINCIGGAGDTRNPPQGWGGGTANGGRREYGGGGNSAFGSTPGRGGRGGRGGGNTGSGEAPPRGHAGFVVIH